MGNLQTLVLSNNPLSHFQIRPLPALTELRTLHLRNTQRTLSNIPVNLEPLVHLADVDLSQNHLTKELNLIDWLIDWSIYWSIDFIAVAILRELKIFGWGIRNLSNFYRKLTFNIPVFDWLVNKQAIDWLYDYGLIDFKIPEGLLVISGLKRLNLGSNMIDEVSPGIERWNQLETLILSRNKVSTDSLGILRRAL